MLSPIRRGRLGLLFACLLLGLLAFRFPVEDGPFQRIAKSLATFYGTSLPEKAYLHLDRPFYASGETIWFRAYVVEADSHRPDTLSKVLYVELLSPRQRVVAQRTLRLKGGLASGDIALPDTLPTGTYQLRAYTSWMRNAGAAFFFSRPLALVSAAGPRAAVASSPKVEVAFFPEGGNLVAGLESEVGFKAMDERGHGVAVQGTVVDARNQVLASFSSRHLGMGSFRLTPEAGQQYRAIVTLPSGTKSTIALPSCQPAGYVLHASETPTDFLITMRQRLGAGAPASQVLLLAQVRGTVVYAARVPLGDAPALAKLPKAKFRPGLAHITLFDEQGTAQCERLVFTPNLPGVRLTLVPDKPAYAPREAVRLRLAATDAAGQPVAGHFSVAVAAQAPGPADGPTIVSHLLLSSDLAGVIEDPGYYFREPATPETQQALNDLLLTQGWRRFVWKELLAGQLSERRFALEQGLAVSGQVLTAANQPAAARQVSYLQTNPRREAQFKTDATGHFSFYGLDGLDTTLVMLRAQPAKGEKELAIRLLAPPPGEVQPPDALFLTASNIAVIGDYASRSQQQRTVAGRQQLAADKSILLDKVSVRGQRAAAPADGAMRTYSNTNAAVVQVAGQIQPGDTRNIFQYLQGRVAGVAVSGNHINIRQTASIQDQSTGGFRPIDPLYLMDGSPVSAEVLATYPLTDIQSIDVMNQNSGGIFGMQAYGGIVAVYSRQGGATTGVAAPDDLAAARPGGHAVKVPGYYRAREFYAPRYDAAASALPDPRYTTLYWAPEVHTDATGQAQLSFFTSDAGGTFQAVAEGLSALGTPLRGSATLVVKAPPAK